MKFRFIGAMILSAFANFSFADPINVPADKRDQLQKSLARLVFADQCSKRFDTPEIVNDAETALVNFLQRASVDSAQEVAHAALEKLASQPKPEADAKLDGYLKSRCSALSQSLKDEITQ